MQFRVLPHLDLEARLSARKRWALACGLFICAQAAACSGKSTEGMQGNEGGAGGNAEPSPLDPPSAGEEFDCKGSQVPAASVIRRLTVNEYFNSVESLIGVKLADKSALWPRENGEQGFTNDARAQTVSIEHITTFAVLAEEAIKRMPDKKGFIASHSSCSKLDESCFKGFVEKVAPKFFRRPAAPDDANSLLPLLKTVQMENGTFDDAAELVLLSMLQSPHFLYLVESQRGSGKTRPLNGFEMAARLSYLFLSTTPDDQLLKAAADGELTSDDGLTRQIDRLLGDKASRRSSLTFLENWLHLDRLSTLQSPVAADMAEETRRFFEHVVWEEGNSLTQLFAADYTFASSALATHYKLSPVKDGWQRYEVGNVGRRGLLTQGSVLTSGGEDSSVVNRGLFMLENILCSSVPDPPPGVNNTRPATEPGKPQRWYAEQRVNTAPCSSCHQHIDPLAYGMDGFSGLGVPRDKDESGNAFQTAGRLVTPYDDKGRPYENAQEYAAMLATDTRVRDCLVMKTAQFALARTIEASDACMLAAVRKDVEQGVRYQDVLRSLVKQPAFRSVKTDN